MRSEGNSPTFLARIVTIMTTRHLSLVCLALVVAHATGASVGTEKCDKSTCPGPLAYYEALGCTPVYEQPNDCCAVRYNCDHLKNRDSEKCYVNGKEYAIGDQLKDEDRNPCDIGCRCVKGRDGIASFVCAIVDCFGMTQPGCYRQRSPTQCCGGEEVCPAPGEKRPECVVNGKTYYDGEYFEVPSEPGLTCYCQEGYKGENVEPFCARPKRAYCDPYFKRPMDVMNNCAPVYYSNQSPQTSCSVSTRCQNANDTVIHTHEEGQPKDHHDEMTCKFGNLEMHHGDELNQSTDYSSVCVKCVCEVPPVPTCQRLPDNECDVTKHPPFKT